LLRAAWRLRQGWTHPRTGEKVRVDRFTARLVARFILVGLYTGTRASAICGAALKPTDGRGWVDLDNGVFYRRPQGKRETKKRQPAIRVPPRLLAHMRRWAAKKLAIRAVVEWNGEPINKINKAFRAVRAAAGLGTDVTPHTLRHTCATWLAQRGVPMWQAAGFLGMTEAMFERTYGHHHPDYQQQAVHAFGRQIGDRYKATERERASTNVVKIQGKR